MDNPNDSPSAPRHRFVLLLAGFVVGAVLGYLLAPGDGAGSSGPVVHRRFVNPADETRVGEWIKFQLSDGRIETWKIVTSVRTEPYFQVDFSSYREGGTPEPMRRSMIRAALGAPNKYWRVRSIQFDPIEVGGRAWNSWRVEMSDPQNGADYTYWMTDELPVMGWVRREYVAKDKLYTMDVVDWGFADS